ncbi:helix-turn-helix domain-containing protein [Fibrisoma montanum]|uniref:Helix-turn-helix domain-containing protein n=2 Tax=Fibrisoma montanum TaxID=2305895 RepID=A0A418M5X7_9BACT|nr:helix-turn-helix domain-containing protein [Fibrisoma montanum]
MTYFAGNIRALRQAKKWSQEKLATLLDVRGGTISNYETGTSYPDFKTFVDIVKLFGVSADDIIFKDLSQGEYVAQEPRSHIKEEEIPEKNIYEDRLKEKDELIKALKDSINLYKELLTTRSGHQKAA